MATDFFVGAMVRMTEEFRKPYAGFTMEFQEFLSSDPIGRVTRVDIDGLFRSPFHIIVDFDNPDFSSLGFSPRELELVNTKKRTLVRKVL